MPTQPASTLPGELPTEPKDELCRRNPSEGGTTQGESRHHADGLRPVCREVLTAHPETAVVATGFPELPQLRGWKPPQSVRTCRVVCVATPMTAAVDIPD